VTVRSTKRKVLLGLLVFLLLVTLFLALSVAASRTWVDIWWYGSLGYEFYYWQRALYRYAVFAVVAVVFFSIFFLNFRFASRTLRTGGGGRRSAAQGRKAPGKWAARFGRFSVWVYVPLSAALTLPIVLPLFRNWQAFLLYLFGPNAGISDPVYGKDVSYYLFSFPIYSMVQERLLAAFAILSLAVACLYGLESRLLKKQGVTVAGPARRHLSVLVLVLFLLGMWGLSLQRYFLLYTARHEPLFFGPGFVEMRIIVPLIWAAILLVGGIGLWVLFFFRQRRGLNILFGLIPAIGIVLVLRYTDLLPRLVERFFVRPNQISMERPYIQSSIQASLEAYKLGNVETREFDTRPSAGTETTTDGVGRLRNVPLWTEEVLDDVYEQLQGLRTYYQFPAVRVDRYELEGEKQQVFLAARELDYARLPPGAHNWVNKHMSYTHGYGAVMSPASQPGGEPVKWFLEGIPPRSDVGIHMDQPGVYYGLADSPYCLVPNGAGEIDYPQGSENVMTHYRGKGGVAVSSLFRKLLFAFFLRNKNFFFTHELNEDSRILFRRNIRDRVQRLVPFLLLDRSAYPVVTSGRIYWILDAYTKSARYPNAVSTRLENGTTLNYIRNSVKIVVDAYDGTVSFYIFDPDDPIIRGYDRIYPGLFRSREEMPADLKSHVRYPRDLFHIQMKVYAEYHQTDPEVFFEDEDMWEFPKAPGADRGGAEKMEPYYLTVDLIEPERMDFLLFVPMVPAGRQNLRALCIAGCDPPYYGKIIVYRMPKGHLEYGPAQIDSLINENTMISERFTLWDQMGSKMQRGKMVILPVGRKILYIEPVYLESQSAPVIPRLQRVIIAREGRVVMEPSLEEAYAALQEVDREGLPKEGAKKPSSSEPTGTEAVVNGKDAAGTRAHPPETVRGP
jgi:uncharacterized membrane protein (UPF0182 family)